MRDVAAHVGVSLKTVSRVLNGEASVRGVVRQRVVRAMRELNYRPNSHARSLALGRSGTLGVSIAMSAERAFGRPFFDEVMRGIGEVADDENLDILLHPWGGRISAFDLCAQGKVDGLILMNMPLTDRVLSQIRGPELPVVLTFRPRLSDRSARQYRWVDVDNVAGTYEATNYLVGLGHTRLALLNGPRDLAVSELRLAGFTRAVKEAGAAVTRSWSSWGEFSSDSGRDCFLSLQAASDGAPATAVLCGDDTIALGVLEGARRRGLEVPRDLSVIGFDDITLARYVRPALTTVRQDAVEKGRAAAKMLIGLLNGSVEVHQVVLAPELIVRESTGPVRRDG